MNKLKLNNKNNIILKFSEQNNHINNHATVTYINHLD